MTKLIHRLIAKLRASLEALKQEKLDDLRIELSVARERAVRYRSDLNLLMSLRSSLVEGTSTFSYAALRALQDDIGQARKNVDQAAAVAEKLELTINRVSSFS